MSEPVQSINNHQDSSASKSLRVYSCVLCQKRKIKCDRQQPCSACRKAGIECIFRAPPPPRRQKGKNLKADLLNKIKKYEELLQNTSNGQEENVGNGEEMNYEHDNAGPRSGEEAGVISRVESFERASSRSGLTSQRSNSKSSASLEHISTDSMLLEPTAEALFLQNATLRSTGEHRSRDLRLEAPSPVQIFTLWQIFLDNVNPLTKLIHAPSVQHQILQATRDFDNLPKGTKALIFAIFLSSVMSLSNIECEEVLGESKPSLLARYSTATREALAKAEFLQSKEMSVLQAYTLWIGSLIPPYDANAVWLLTGTALRMGQRLNFHKENILAKLPPFEAEMRRRVWWQIVLLDGRAGQVSESGPSILDFLPMVTMPSNLNDADLFPDMKTLPTSHDRPTEMLFCSMRFELSKFFYGFKDKLMNPSVSMVEKDQCIDTFRDTIREKYFDNIDHSIPLHSISAALPKLAVCKVRLRVHHPRQYPDNGANLPSSEKDLLFTTSLELTECAMGMLSEPTIRRYVWHVNMYFPNFHLDAFILLLEELKHRRTGLMVERAWQQVSEMYHNHPQIITDKTNPSFVAVGDLTLQAWNARERAVGWNQHEVPEFISLLRSQRPAAPRAAASTNNNSQHTNLSTNVTVQGDASKSNPAQQLASSSDGQSTTEMQLDFTPPDFSPVDWAYWDELLQNCDLIPIGTDFFDDQNE